DFHFETQPIPNALSPLFHALPHGVHAAGVLFNHLAELLLPLCLLGPRKLRALAGLGMIVFQLILIFSGNLSFLNWLTIVPLLASFDDEQLRASVEIRPTARLHQRVTIALAVVIGALSIAPVLNMLSPRQAMNAGFDPLMLVNSYGAFGSVGRERPELILEGAMAEDGPWEAYELPYKPGDLQRRPGVVSPLQPRLDWQLWFAAMSQIEREPWLVYLVVELLEGNDEVQRLFAHVPFDPPKFVRILRYRYRFAPSSSDAYWVRDRVELYLRPVSREMLRALRR
ncbi:MAG TPA: lipase maturation factor family protein, partial [Polyangiales bacterium]|nr:lipase maturation factor family protein [Polyangiales bacterium]